MSKDLTLLKMFSSRELCEKYLTYVNTSRLEPEIRTILSDFKAYFEEFEVDSIDFDVFPTWFNQYRHPELTENQYAIYKSILDKVESAPEDILESILSHYRELETSELIREVLDEEFDLERLKEIIENHEKSVKISLTDIDVSCGDYKLSSRQRTYGVIKTSKSPFKAVLSISRCQDSL